MLRQAIVALSAAFFIFSAVGPVPAYAAAKCRDITTKKFATCGAPNTEPVPTKATKCRDKTTKKFAKCDAPNTEPMPSKP